MGARAVVVCGGRNYGDYDRVVDVLSTLNDDDVIWQGGARGADALARKAGEELGHDVVEVPAQWARHGKAAGPIRNRLMLKLANPRLVIAFPGGRGTADMVNVARKAGVSVALIEPVEAPDENP